jgi:hypothetical protein
MSRVQAAFVRAALLYLVATGLLGVALQAAPGRAAAFRVVHVHAGVLGFFLSLVMGVAFWLLPRPGGRRTPRAEAWAFALFHAGLAARMALEPWWRLGGPPELRWALLVAGLLTAAGMTVFAAALWGRAVDADTVRRARRTSGA